MGLREPGHGPSLIGVLVGEKSRSRIMANRTSAIRISDVIVIAAAAAALLLSVEAAAARSGVAAAAPGGSGHTGPSHVGARAPGARPFFRHHRGAGVYLPATGALAYGAYEEPAAGAVPDRTSADIRYTYTYDVPWDWAHRYPPNVVPSNRPYVSSCPVETVTVPGRRGDHTVNITRCY